jgi:SAM-dependent methyltransferase
MTGASKEASAAAGHTRDVDPWSTRAARFDRMGRQAGSADATLEALSPLCRPADLVMDVGAGAGRHVVGLAKQVGRIIAVEPSAAMLGFLGARLTEEGLTNVEVAPEAWPLTQTRVADVVYSAHVLYGVDEAAPFLQAMTRSARRTCALVLGLSAPADQLDGLWLALHGSRRPPRPAALEALALLHQLGSRAALSIIPGSERPLRFTSSDEDVVELCRRMDIPPGPASLSRVRAALDELAPASDGAHTLGVSGPNALLTWPGEAPKS